MTRQEMLSAIEALPEENKEWSDVKRILRNPERVSDNLIKRAYDKYCKSEDPALVAYRRFNQLYREMESLRSLKDNDCKGDFLALANSLLDASAEDYTQIDAICVKIGEEMQELKPLAQEWAEFTRSPLVNR